MAIDVFVPTTDLIESLSPMKTTMLKLAMVALIVMISACAGTPAAPTETLEQRVQGRWDVLLSDDLEAAYQYFSPGMRETVRYQDFVRKMASRTVRWTGASFQEVTSCDVDVCKVKTLVRYEVRAPAGAGTINSSKVMHENWIRSDGQWYYVPEEVL